MRQSGVWPILCQLMAILGNLVDMDFKFVCPAVTLTLVYKPILKSIRPKLAILSPKILQCHSPKSLLLLHFSMNLSESLKINVGGGKANFGKHFFWQTPKRRVFFAKVCQKFMTF